MTTPGGGAAPKVTVIGGTGFFGSRVLADVLTHTDALVVAASRRGYGAPASHPRLRFGCCDVTQYASVRAVAEGSDVIVHCAGPFYVQEAIVARAAIDAGAHYVDISEDREQARHVRLLDQKARDAGVALLTGASVVPGMESIIAADMAAQFERPVSFRAFAAPDTHGVRGKAMYATMLRVAGRRWPIWRGGRWQQVRGWSEPEWVVFPPPVGRRLVYLVPGMADQDEVGGLGYESVEFRAGSEHPSLNRLLGAASIFNSGLPLPLSGLTPVARGISSLAGFRREPGGAAMFESKGFQGGTQRTRWLGISVATEGERIPAALAGIAVEDLLSGSLSSRGILRASDWCSWGRLRIGLHERDLALHERMT